jgi:hypothetical protein
MYVNEKSLHALGVLLPVIRLLPEHTSIDVGIDGALLFQARTQEQVRGIRGAFPGVVVWTKQYSESLQWWEYTTAIDGVPICIYAVREGPPTCRRIEEEVEVEREVPVAFEKQMVVEKRVRWECGDGV